MPREERFFQLLEKHAIIVVAGAEALRGLLRSGDNIEACCKEIFQCEAEADEVTRQVLVAARQTFITPFDRTDMSDCRKMCKNRKTRAGSGFTGAKIPRGNSSQVCCPKSNGKGEPCARNQRAPDQEMSDGPGRRPSSKKR